MLALFTSRDRKVTSLSGGNKRAGKIYNFTISTWVTGKYFLFLEFRREINGSWKEVCDCFIVGNLSREAEIIRRN